MKRFLKALCGMAALLFALSGCGKPAAPVLDADDTALATLPPLVLPTAPNAAPGSIDAIIGALGGEGADAQTPAPDPTPAPTPDPTPVPTQQPAPARGNTVGNIVNGGIVADDGESQIVFNTLDAGEANLYRGYVYYVNHRDGGRLYRQPLTGDQAACIAQATNVRYVNIVEDWIFYRSTDEKYSVHRMNLDGTGDVKLSSLRASRLAAVDGSLYFANWDGDTTGIWRMDYDGGNLTCLYGGDIPLFINVANGYVWWVSDSENNCLARTRIADGVTEFCTSVTGMSALNVQDGLLYFYMKSATKSERGIYVMTEDLSELYRVYAGSGVQNINIADGMLYFRLGGDTNSTEDDILYCCGLDGSGLAPVS